MKPMTLNATVWMLLSTTACISEIDNTLAVDNDGDGYTELQGDCDDEQAQTYPGVAFRDSDTDCMRDVDGDGFGDSLLTEDVSGLVAGTDCNDTDATSSTVVEDADCDSILTVDDCDDSDATSTSIDNDADCDGVLTADDCDDDDPTSSKISEDADCDGVLRVDDCNDSSILAPNFDADCDGILEVGVLASGASNTCWVDDSETLQCWGSEENDVNQPPVEAFEQVSVGYDWACAVATDGHVQCWGTDTTEHAVLSPPFPTAQSVSSGLGLHNCSVLDEQVLDEQGLDEQNLSCWGWNDNGQTDAPLGTFAQVSVGGVHTCALDTSGVASCWGANTFGQINVPEDMVWNQISAGQVHTCGIDNSQTLHCWGNDDDGQSSPPVGTFAQVSAGSKHTCGIRTDGRVFCWGDDTSSQASVPNGLLAHQVSVGALHTCVLTLTDEVQCWGDDHHGQVSSRPQ